MKSIPAFHARAASEAKARAEALQEERDRAELFLAELDLVLAESLAD